MFQRVSCQSTRQLCWHDGAPDCVHELRIAKSMVIPSRSASPGKAERMEASSNQADVSAVPGNYYVKRPACL
jgi:hypothetical protein